MRIVWIVSRGWSYLRMRRKIKNNLGTAMKDRKMKEKMIGTAWKMRMEMCNTILPKMGKIKGKIVATNRMMEMIMVTRVMEVWKMTEVMEVKEVTEVM
jgi:hypothetical protein